MRVKVLGSAAGGGFPQWNCGCSNCDRLRAGVLKGRTRTQAQVAVSSDRSKWYLVNASPDLRQQLSEHSEFAPPAGTRSTPVAAIILTSADVDCVLGLFHLREFQPLRIYSTASVRRALRDENTLFQTLERSNPPVSWEDLLLDRQMAHLPSRLAMISDADQFIVCPECAVHECHVAFLRMARPFLPAAREVWSIEQSLVALR